MVGRARTSYTNTLEYTNTNCFYVFLIPFKSYNRYTVMYGQIFNPLSYTQVTVFFAVSKNSPIELFTCEMIAFVEKQGPYQRWCIVGEGKSDRKFAGRLKFGKLLAMLSVLSAIQRNKIKCN